MRIGYEGCESRSLNWRHITPSVCSVNVRTVHLPRRQFRSTAILDVLARVRRPEWERLLGVADVDLFVPELNFVFGEADSRRGVAVFSLARLETTDRALFLRRAATEAGSPTRSRISAVHRSAVLPSGTTPWKTAGSAIAFPTDISGFSDEYGSW